MMLALALVIVCCATALSLAEGVQFGATPFSQQSAAIPKTVDNAGGVSLSNDSAASLHVEDMDVTTIVLPAIDLDAVKERDARENAELSSLAPFRWGVHVNQDLTDLGATCKWNQVGPTDYLAEGKLCIIKLTGKLLGASTKNFRLSFSEFKLPQGAQVILHALHRADNFRTVLLTTEDVMVNRRDFSFTTPVVSTGGGTLVIEVYVPSAKFDDSDDSRPLSMLLRGVTLGFQDVNKEYEEKASWCTAGACEENVKCVNEITIGENVTTPKSWQMYGRAIARIDLGGIGCTGALITDPLGLRNLVLTAHHCLKSAINGGADPTEFVFEFNYEKPCGTGCGWNPATKQPKYFSVQGAILHAGQAAGDWALLEVMEPIMSKHVYYLGWDASFNNVQDLDSDSSMNQEGLLPYAVVVHHPFLDTKAVSTFGETTHGYCQIYSGNSLSGVSCLKKNDHYVTAQQWTSGWLEPGSSGAPIIAADSKRLLGQLLGIDSCSHGNICKSQACTNNVGYFGAFKKTFDKMKYVLFGCHLDPTDENATPPYFAADGSSTKLPAGVSPLPSCPDLSELGIASYPKSHAEVYRAVDDTVEGGNTFFTITPVLSGGRCEPELVIADQSQWTTPCSSDGREGCTVG